MSTLAAHHTRRRLRRIAAIVVAGALLSTPMIPRIGLATPVAMASSEAGASVADTALNNGFESADGALPAQWGLYHSSEAQFARDTAVAHSGDASARISDSTGDSDGVPAFYLTPSVTVIPGRTYTASVWARGQNASGGTRIALAWFDDEYRYLGQTESSYLPTGTTSSWTQLTASSVAPAGAMLVEIHLKSSNNSGVAWFDDVTFLAPTSVGPQATGVAASPTATATALPPTATATKTPLPPTPTATKTPLPTATKTPLPPTATATATRTPLVPTATATSVPVSGGDFVTRSGTRLLLNGHTFRFAGANIYYLGLDENVGGVNYPTDFRVDDALQTARDMGATVVRGITLGFSVGCSLCLEPSLGHFNDTALQHFDYAIASAQKRGLRLIIPLVDNYRYYHGGRCQFTDWRGWTKPTSGDTTCADDANSDKFFTDSTVRADFEQYISHLLNHVNTITGVAYKDDPTIMAWEIGGELDTHNKGDWTILGPWMSAIAAYIKSVDTHHLIGDAYAWQQKNQSDLADPNIDLYTLHSYPMNVAQLQQTAAQVAAAGKAFFVGEFDWDNHGGGDSLSAYLSAIESTPEVSGDLYWSLFGHNDNYGFEQHNDGYTLHYTGDSTDMQNRASLLRDHAFAMSGLPVAPDVISGSPIVTSVSRSGSHNVIAWRGAAGAATYSVQASTTGPNGPWTTICQQCATDNSTPWRDPTSSSSGRVWYQVIPYTSVGVAGAASGAYQAQS